MGAGFDSAWEIFSKVIWPIVVMYVAYLHRELTIMATKIDAIQTKHYEHKAEVNRDFVTRNDMVDLEAKVTALLNRIDDKVTRILEKKDRN